ncbi:MAG: D-glycero-beta-D-manno-heptose 1-phosphate adenylyltransferase [Candidatus Omnitrophota bacterium]
MSGTKIISRLVLSRKIPKLKARGKKIVFTNGCFDILHYGHVRYLENAKAGGDILIVGLNSDASVKKIKGKGRPVVNQNDRARVLAGLASVDYVVIFAEDTPLQTIRMLKPDVLIKGADWNKDKIVGADLVSSYGGKVATVELAKGRSTTNLIKKIAALYGKK